MSSAVHRDVVMVVPISDSRCVMWAVLRRFGAQYPHFWGQDENGCQRDENGRKKHNMEA